MLKNLFAYFVVAVCLGLLVLTSSPYLMSKIPKSYIDYTFRYGDLYRFTNLRDYKIPVEKNCASQRVKKESNVNLYLLGDSHGALLNESQFELANEYHFVNFLDQFHTTLDKTKKNILIIETGERKLHLYYGNLGYTENIKIVSDKNAVHTITDYKRKRIGRHFQPNPEDNLNQVLFYDPVSLFIKEIKANINYKLFNRIDDLVKISKDKKYLYLTETVDPKNKHSAFRVITDEELNAIIENINRVYSHYKNLGFDEVYFAPIPNKENMVEPTMGIYNHLIERLQNNKNLLPPYIDAYTLFKQSPVPVYEISDTHWNCEGQRLWTQTVNSTVLAKY
jgi:hypothetical protein